MLTLTQENLILSKRQEFKSVSNQTVTAVSSADEIRKYKELLDEGIITKKEFDNKKKQIMN